MRRPDTHGSLETRVMPERLVKKSKLRAIGGRKATGPTQSGSDTLRCQTPPLDSRVAEQASRLFLQPQMAQNVVGEIVHFAEDAKT